ncbi:hypothetical protein N483_03360 [Pseudoalteromonas luteoviolacea NCIMB 1944]|uniref:Uncharacterized protein n=1 Tax=Pseudoalteromonas luteoviolacea (strain 2ta16) TaxID=1353533 RepID=V4HAL1_PSEL2|nr:hypothetical protein PL2TA16_00501 [Pseudoalteromonas luteoviolacea 2ta16]KZN32197.1 hypothetical protein N483_03360 [Pseudoalteromonas luteoviolacea NCIMB 1944]
MNEHAVIYKTPKALGNIKASFCSLYSYTSNQK